LTTSCILLCSCDRASWVKCGERIPTRCNNIDVYCQLQMLIIDYCLDMFRASLCPSSGEKTMCYCIWVFCWQCWMWLVAVLWCYVVGCEHCEGCSSAATFTVKLNGKSVLGIRHKISVLVSSFFITLFGLQKHVLVLKEPIHYWSDLTNIIMWWQSLVKLCSIKTIKIHSVVELLHKDIQCIYIYIYIYTGCPRRNVPDFGRVFLMLKYTDITQHTYVQSWTVTEIMTSEVWNSDSCYTLIDYQIHIKTGRIVWFL